MFPILLMLWFIFSGSLTASNAIKGVIICALITLLCLKYMNYQPRKVYKIYLKIPKVLRYLCILFKEIIVSNLVVFKLVWSSDKPEPVLVRFRSRLKTDAAKVLVANSITLTPGTFTVGLKDDLYLVHALDASLAEGIETGVFFREAERLED